MLEKGYAGHIRALGGASDGDLVSVSGGVPAIVRAWDLAAGHIIHEWPIAEQNPDRSVLLLKLIRFKQMISATSVINLIAKEDTVYIKRYNCYWFSDVSLHLYLFLHWDCTVLTGPFIFI